MTSQHHRSQNVVFVLVNHVSYLPLKEKYPFTTLGARIRNPVSTTTESTSSPLRSIAYCSRSRRPTVMARRTLRLHTGNNLQGPDKDAVPRSRDHSPSEDLKCKHGHGPECESCMAIVEHQCRQWLKVAKTNQAQLASTEATLVQIAQGEIHEGEQPPASISARLVDIRAALAECDARIVVVQEHLKNQNDRYRE